MAEIVFKNHRHGCLVCGEELEYHSEPSAMICHMCGITSQSLVACRNGHFICDECHSGSANNIIERYCIRSESLDPVKMANHLMDSSKVTMHGPEHHFLVTAVLLSAYYNLLNQPELKRDKIIQARFRCEKVPGGFCGSHGTCGAGVASGIFISLITDATPLSLKEWQLSNLRESLKSPGSRTHFHQSFCCHGVDQR